MAEETRAKAEAALKEAETVTTHLLPEPKGELTRSTPTDPALKAEIERRKARDRHRATPSRSSASAPAAQAELQRDQPGHALGRAQQGRRPGGRLACARWSSSLRGFSVDELDPNRKQSWWERLVGKTAPIAEFMAQFEQVQGQIDKITGELLTHEHTLLKDIKSLDKLYEKTLDFYDELALYIAAGEAKLAELDATDDPRQGGRGAGARPRARG